MLSFLAFHYKVPMNFLLKLKMFTDEVLADDSFFLEVCV